MRTVKGSTRRQGFATYGENQNVILASPEIEQMVGDSHEGDEPDGHGKLDWVKTALWTQLATSMSLTKRGGRLSSLLRCEAD